MVRRYFGAYFPRASPFGPALRIENMHKRLSGNAQQLTDSAVSVVAFNDQEVHSRWAFA